MLEAGPKLKRELEGKFRPLSPSLFDSIVVKLSFVCFVAMKKMVAS